MKKLLSKKPVMITFIALAVVFLAVYIGMLVRPVSYGFNYTSKNTATVAGKEITTTYKVNFKSDRVARQTMIVEGEKETKGVSEYWIYRDGNKILMIDLKEIISSTEFTDAQIEEMNKECMTKKEYEVEVEKLEKMKKENAALYELEMKGATEVGLFKFGEDIAETKDIDESSTNTQAIVFAIVHGVVTVALLAFAGLAVYYAVKKK